MKKLTRIFSLLLAITMVLSFSLTGVSAQEAGEAVTSGTVESIDWVYTAEDKTITVTGNINGTGTVPYQLDDNWTHLDYNRIVVNEGIGEIIANGFNSCKAEVIILPTSLRKIGDGAFKGATNLKYLHIPTGVTTIGDYILQKCTLSSLYVPKTVTAVNSAWCYELTLTSNIYLPVGSAALSNGTPFKDNVFNKYYGKYTLVDSMLTKADGTFTYGLFDNFKTEAVSGDTITVLQDITVSSMPEIAEGVNIVYHGNLGGTGTVSSANWVYKAADKTITVTPVANSDGIIKSGLTDAWENYDYDTVIVKDGFTEIAENGFMKGKASKLQLPTSLRKIGTQAMASWTNLKQLHIPEGVTTLGSYPFKNMPLETIYFPSTMVTFSSWYTNITTSNLTIYYGKFDSSFYGRQKAMAQVDTMKTDADGVYTYGNFKAIVESAVAGDTVTVLSFANNVTEMPTIPEGVKVEYLAGVGGKGTVNSATWVYNVFDNTVTVTPVADGDNIVPTGLAGKWTAYTYSKVIIGEGFTALADTSLQGMTAQEIVLPSTLTSIGTAALKNALSLKALDIPAAVTSFGGYCFENCNLDYIFMPSNVTSFSSWYYNLTVDKVYYIWSTGTEKEVNLRFSGKGKAVDAVKYSADGTKTYARLRADLNNAADGDVFNLITQSNDNVFVTSLADITINVGEYKTANVFMANTNGDDAINVLDFIRLKKRLADSTVKINTAGLAFRSEFGAQNLVNLTQHLLGV